MAAEITAIVLDSGPIIKNEPSVSSLLKRTSKLITLPAIVNREIRDQATRSRLQTTLLPFLEQRTPTPQSVKAVLEFAKRTGDAAVLSRVDLELLALTRDVEIELNGGDWRIRKTPGERLAPRPQTKQQSDAKQEDEDEGSIAEPTTSLPQEEQLSDSPQDVINDEIVPMSQLSLNESPRHETQTDQNILQSADDDSTSASDSETASSDGWITPSNLARHQANENAPHASSTKTPTKLQCCLITSDFAVQNTALMMNLNLLSPSSSMSRIRHLRTYILRCHACFKTCKDTTRQFCPSCGGATLTRVTCTTDANGDFKLHLKKNMQWNTRGDKYSIPKPVSGSANGKTSVNRSGRKGGGKEGWGKELIFTEDQKECARAVGSNGRRKEKDLMDDDFLPSILSGDRSKMQGRPRIGAGRNVNSKKR